MFFYPQEDGSVLWTGSFNQEAYDAYMAEHSTKAKVKAAAKAADAESEKEEPAKDAAAPAKKTAAPAEKGAK